LTGNTLTFPAGVAVVSEATGQVVRLTNH